MTDADGGVKLSLREIGDCREVMRRMIAEGVKAQMCVTSPPYWGLRDYGTGTWEGGDGSECTHKYIPNYASSTLTTWAGKMPQETRDRLAQNQAIPYKHTCAKCGARRVDKQIGLEEMHDCMAWARTEIVSEALVYEEESWPVYDDETGDYIRTARGRRKRLRQEQRISHLCGECHVCVIVEVFRLVREVLTDDGVLFLNYGDSYVSGPSGTRYDNAKGFRNSRDYHTGFQGIKAPGLKPKDLVGIPWRVAFALQADGWYLRSDIIWAKPNPMPESVTDRPTKSHEYLFLLAKSPRYFYDQEAVKEPLTPGTSPPGNRTAYDSGRPDGMTLRGNRAAEYLAQTGRNLRTVWTIPSDEIVSGPAYRIRDDISDEQLAKLLDELCEPVEIITDRPLHAHEYMFLLTKGPRYFYDAEAVKEPSVDATGVSRGGSLSRFGRTESLISGNAHRGDKEYASNGSRNLRTVWTIPSEPFAEAHFATFPKRLVERCIMAGTSEKGHCQECGARWVRVTERVTGEDMSWAGRSPKNEALHNTGHGETRGNTLNSKSVKKYYENQPRRNTVDWRPTCQCGLDPVPDIVLDPFLGSGTTAEVAERLGRGWIGIELNSGYETMQKRRTAQQGMAL